MKRIWTLLICTALLWSCDYDDSDVRKRLDDLDARIEAVEKQLKGLNDDMKTLHDIVEAFEGGYVIMSTEEVEGGYRLVFSNGKTLTVNHGKGGVDAPQFGIKRHTDGKYYWTLDGEFYTPDGEMIPVTGARGDKGETGDNGVTPVLGVDAQGYWTVDTGNGPQRILAEGQPVSATGPKGETGERGDSFFQSVTENESSVTIVLADGSQITIPKIDAGVKLAFADSGDLTLYWGDRAALGIEAEGIKSALITAPCNWSASVNLSARKVTVAAPGLLDEEAEQEGYISIIAVTESGQTVTVSRRVATSGDVTEMAKINSILKEIVAPALDENAPVDLRFRLVKPKSDYTNLEIPESFTAAAVPSITVEFSAGVTSSIALGSYSCPYDGEVVMEMPAGAVSAYTTMQVRKGSGRLSGGTHTSATSQTGTSLLVDSDTRVGSLTVNAGHLINFGTIEGVTTAWTGIDPVVQLLNYGRLGEVTQKNGTAQVVQARRRSAGSSKWIERVTEYRPAPGQFTNMQVTWSLPQNISNIEGGMSTTAGLSLGTFGGSVTFRFDHTVANFSGADFCIHGNAFATNNEPGAVMVALDTNGNGMPDDNEWYELEGSMLSDGATVKDYRMTFTRPETVSGPSAIEWSDNKGGSGTFPRGFYARTYWPTGLEGETLEYVGNKINFTSTSKPLEYGYVDNYSQDYAQTVNGDSDTKNSNKFDISTAVDREGNRVYLTGVDFIRVYNPVYFVNGMMGEIGTEVCGAISLNVEKLPVTASGAASWGKGTVTIK